MIGLRCRLPLHLEIGGGRPPVPLPFVVDSGASYSFVGLELAQRSGLPVPPPESEVELPLLSARGTAPVRVRPGRLRAWWNEGCEGYPFDWPVLFLVNAPLGVPSVLGLGGVVKTCRWTFDGGYSPDSPYGFLTLNDTR